MEWINIKIILLNSLVGNLWAGIISGIIATVIYVTFSHLKKLWRYRNCYQKYEGVYLSYEKSTKETTEKGSITARPTYVLKLKRSGNRFMITGISVLGYPDLTGELLMSDQTPFRGSGYYRHKKPPDGIISFGFIEVQLAGNELLAHFDINHEHNRNFDAYRWVKIDPSDVAAKVGEYRAIQRKNFMKKWHGRDPLDFEYSWFGKWEVSQRITSNLV